MKTLMKIFFAVALIGLLVTCTKQDESSWTRSGSNSEDLKTVTVTVPFVADFVGTYTYAGPHADCGELPMGLITADGVGTATHMGNITIHFEFCCDFVTGYYGPAYNTYLVAANGDTLFVSCVGQVKDREPDMPPYVVNYWKDPFVILGGTGRFEGATGSGMTDDYNSTEDPNSHSHWAGTITMVRGKNN